MAFVSSNDVGAVVAIIGATGAVGKDLIEALCEGDFPLKGLVLFTSLRSGNELTEVDGRRIRIHPTPDDLIEHPLLTDVDIVFFASPPEVIKKHGKALASEGFAVIDMGGVLAGKIPFSIEGIQENDDLFSEYRICCTPSAPALIASRVIAAVQHFGLRSLSGQVLLSAGCMGKQGIEELSQQVAALFGAKEPPRKVFPNGLAFDVISTFGNLQQGWTDPERRVAIEVASLLKMSPKQIALSLQVIPVFAGVILCGRISFLKEISHEDLVDAFSNGKQLEVGDPPPGPRRLVGRKSIYIGRIRKDPLEDCYHFWAAADNLRAGAVDNAILLAYHYWDQGLI